MKTCTICGLSKPFDDFHREKKCKQDGRMAKCKPCKRIITKQYYDKNKKILLANRKRKRLENPEKYDAKVRARYKKYYAKNKKKIFAQRRARYKKHKKKIMAYAIAWQKKRIESDPSYAQHLKEYRAAYYQKNKEILKQKLKLKKEKKRVGNTINNHS